jgi:phospholipid/cholesterol/gamma-HCH transport system substrate-binding protein
MRSRARSEVAVGLFVWVAGALVLWGYFWLTGEPLGHRGYEVAVRLPDAGGLQRGDRVRLRGVEVGTVRAVRLGSGAVEASVRLDRGVRVPRDSRAALRAEGVFGERYLELVPGRGPEPLREGDALTAAAWPSVSERIERVGTQAESLLAQVRAAVDPRTIEDVRSSARSLSELLGALAAASASVRDATAGLERAFDAPRLDRTAAALEASATELTAAAAELRAAMASLASVLGKVDRGEGLLGRMVNDPALYDALWVAVEDVRAATRDASALLRDIRERPGRYVRVSLF